MWDGPRGHVYVRLEDNHDADVSMVEDRDFRMQLSVIADYPIYVDAGGVQQPTNLNQRGTARRRLFGRFEPAGRTAIRTDGDLNISGSLEVCGACGGVHSNENLVVEETLLSASRPPEHSAPALHQEPLMSAAAY